MHRRGDWPFQGGTTSIKILCPGDQFIQSREQSISRWLIWGDRFKEGPNLSWQEKQQEEYDEEQEKQQQQEEEEEEYDDEQKKQLWYREEEEYGKEQEKEGAQMEEENQKEKKAEMGGDQDNDNKTKRKKTKEGKVDGHIIGCCVIGKNIMLCSYLLLRPRPSLSYFYT